MTSKLLAGLLPLTKVAVRLGLCGGALYCTKEVGVWGDSVQGEAALRKLQNFQLKNEVHSMLGAEVADQLPDLSLPEEVTDAASTVNNVVTDVNKNLYSYYNSGVTSSLEGLKALPDTVAQYGRQAVSALQDLAK